MTPMLEQLQSILESAVRRQPAGSSDELLPLIMVRELAAVFGLRGVEFWVIEGGSIECVARSEASGQAGVADAALRGRLELAAGSPGRLFAESTESGGLGRQTIGAEAAAGLVVVLEIHGREIPAGLAEAVVEILADLFRRSRLIFFRRYRAGVEILDQLLPVLYGGSSEREVGEVLAADLPAVLGCSRVCVCVREGAGWRVESATGSESVNERAEAVLRIGQSVAEQSERGTGVGATELLGGGMQWVFPMSVAGVWSESSRALVLEFSAGARADRELMQRVLRQIRGVLRNLERGSGVARVEPKAGLLWRGRRGPAIVSAAVCVLLLTLIPVELWVGASGRLLPQQRLQIHAPENGIVTEVAVEDGSEVQAGQLLMQVRSDELSMELESVLGQTAASEARLAAIDQLKATRAADVALLSAEQSELSAGMDSLRLRRQLLERRLAALAVRAEFSGRVYADEAAQRMTGRPLVRGQLLLELADPEGAWELQLEVPEREARHVISAAAVGRPEISFFSESAPETVHRTQASRIGRAAVINGSGQLVMRVEADLAAELSGQATERPGAGVRAEIACGRSSLGYVLLRRFLEFVQRGGR